MRIQPLALAVAGGILWGGTILLLGLAEFVWPAYGRAFLELAASIYPGYVAGHTIGQVLIGTVYGLFDGAVGGFLVAWVYNLASADPETPARQ
jgi:hypothetical protein